MLRTETELRPSEKCTSESQPDLSDRMRAILISWLIEVHLKYLLQPETLFITVNLVDRYCSIQQVPRNEYQLLGVTAMLIASKYEEIFVPKIEDFVDITDNTYSKEQVLRQEFQILKLLDYNITFPTTYRFLERYNTLSDGTEETFLLGSYLCELCLIEVNMNKWLPSRLASSALYLSKKMLKKSNPWPRDLQQIAMLTEREVRDSAREICVLINLAHQKRVFSPVYKKYSTAKFMRVAQVPVKIRQDAQQRSSCSTSQHRENNDTATVD